MRKRFLTALVPLLLAGLPSLPAAGPAAASPDELGGRRAALSAVVGTGSLLLLPPVSAPVRSGDTHFEFRQDSALFYLTGIDQPGTALVLMPGNASRTEILFIAPRDPAREVWDGRRLSRDEARALSGIEEVWWSTQLEDFLAAMGSGNSYGVSRYAPGGEYHGFRSALHRGEAEVWLPLVPLSGLREALSAPQELARDLRERFPGIRVRDAAPLIDAARQVKSKAEIALIRRAVDITLEAQREAMSVTAPGVGEHQVEAAIEYVFRARGGSGWAFPSIVASGPNSTTLHYQRNERVLEDGDLLLVDIGAEYGLYAADVTRTFPVSGRFTPDQAAIYDIVLKAQQAAIELARPGSSIPEIHARSAAVVSAGLARLGLVTDAASGEYRHFFMHGTSHWLGLDVHDAGDNDVKLRAGMILTVEPGIYIRRDVLDHLPDSEANRRFKETVRGAVRRYAGIGVRIEDDILVTDDEPVNLSAGLPRERAEIEDAMRRKPAHIRN